MKTFDTTPKPAFCLALQNMPWTIAGALSECIDNSYGAGRGNAEKVVITFDQKEKNLRIFDNGRGMDEIGRLFQLGNTIGRSPGDIGNFGSGGTMAILWLASAVRIWSIYEGKLQQDVVRWKEDLSGDKFPVISSERFTPGIANTPIELLESGHGTLILLSLLDERNLTSSNISNVVRDLSETYAPALRDGRSLIWKTIGRNGGQRILTDSMPELAKVEEFEGSIIAGNGDRLRFSAKIGISAEDLPLVKSVVSIGYGARIIKKTREFFASEKNERKYQGLGICGYIDLGEGWQPYLSTTKNDVNDYRVWNLLSEFVFEKIEPLLKEKEEKSLSVFFDGLALQLEAMFKGHGPLEVRVVKVPGAEYPDGPPSGVITPHRTSKKHESGDDQDADSKGTLKLEVVPVEDNVLEGALCRFLNDERGENPGIFVNKDHAVVQEALQQRPVNRRALEILISGEIANYAVRDPLFLRRLFPPAVVFRIEELKDNPSSLIQRLLMDRVRAAA